MRILKWNLFYFLSLYKICCHIDELQIRGYLSTKTIENDDIPPIYHSKNSFRWHKERPVVFTELTAQGLWNEYRSQNCNKQQLLVLFGTTEGFRAPTNLTWEVTWRGEVMQSKWEKGRMKGLSGLKTEEEEESSTAHHPPPCIRT